MNGRAVEVQSALVNCAYSRDLTPTQGGASKYSDRFLSRGENVLTFKLFKYGRPDEDLKRYCFNFTWNFWQSRAPFPQT